MKKRRTSIRKIKKSKNSRIISRKMFRQGQLLSDGYGEIYYITEIDDTIGFADEEEIQHCAAEDEKPETIFSLEMENAAYFGFRLISDTDSWEDALNRYRLMIE
jgi:hypothetical protein